MKKPLSITSPNHAVALASYFMLGMAGLTYVLNKDSGVGKLLVATNGHLVADIWSISLMAFGFAAFGSAVTAKFSPRPEHHLRLEMWACVALSIDLLHLVFLIVERSGPAGISFVVPFLLGAVFRAIQIFFEQRLLKRARQHPMKSDSVLADPRDEHGE